MSQKKIKVHEDGGRQSRVTSEVIKAMPSKNEYHHVCECTPYHNLHSDKILKMKQEFCRKSFLIKKKIIWKIFNNLGGRALRAKLKIELGLD